MTKKHKSKKISKQRYTNEPDNMSENINFDNFDPDEQDISADDLVEDSNDNDNDNDNSEQSVEIVHKHHKRPILERKSRERLKAKIVEWLDNDDKIKLLNGKIKKIKTAKKEQEELILKMVTKLGMEDNKIDVHNDNDELRSRVYRHKSVTKGAIKEDIIKEALMEVIRDEKRVDQLVKKIDSRRPINERYYLKRTKGEQQD